MAKNTLKLSLTKHLDPLKWIPFVAEETETDSGNNNGDSDLEESSFRRRKKTNKNKGKCRDSSDDEDKDSGRQRAVKSGAKLKRRPVVRAELWPHIVSNEDDREETTSEDITLAKFLSCFTYIMTTCEGI